MRVLSLCLVFLSLFVVLASPARAAEEVQYLMELTEYASVDDSGGFTKTLNSTHTSFFFRLPSYGVVYYVDMLITCELSTPNSFDATVNGTTWHDLTMIRIDGNLYRVYGNVEGIGATLKFQVDLSSAIMPIVVHSCRISQIEVSQFDITGTCFLSSTSGYSDTIYYNSADEINSRTLGSTGENVKLLLNADEWKKYDFLDYQLLITSADIHSISAYSGDLVLPVESSLVTVSTDRRDSFYLTLRIYVGDLNRITADSPTIRIDLNESGTNSTYISVEAMAGLVNDVESDMFTHWFRKIVNGLDHILGALQYSEGSGELKDKVQDSEQKFDELNEAFESVTKPNVDDIETDISSVISIPDLSYSSSMFTYAFDSNYIGKIIFLVAILATVSFVFYGKRG